MITKETAVAIAYAYREIEAADAMILKIENDRKLKDAPDFRDAFGRQRQLQLGIPGDSSTRVYDVPWTLAVAVIRAHAAEQRRRLVELNECARIELDAPTVEATP